MRYLFFLVIILNLGYAATLSDRGSMGKDIEDGQTDIETFYAEAAGQNDVLILGEAHQNERIADDFVKILEAIEKRDPRRLAVVGLEIFSIYQDEIDLFLGDPSPEAQQILLDTPDREALRGTRDIIEEDGTRKPIVSDQFLKILTTIKGINVKRDKANRVRVLAVDRQPNPVVTFREFQKDTENQNAMIQWATTRDEHMFDILKEPIGAAVARGLNAVIFIGSAHAQKSGVLELTLPVEIPPLTNPISIKWLATRLAENFPETKIVTAEQINPGNTCQDGIEKKLTVEGVAIPIAFDLRSTELGNLENFRCQELPFGTTKHLPEPYKAKDHFDFYTYYPLE